MTLSIFRFGSKFSFITGVETQHFVLESSLAVVSDVPAMSTILLALIANVKGAGTRTGNFQNSKKQFNPNVTETTLTITEKISIQITF